MNIQETLDAAEVMRRSALGEPAKCRLRGRENWSNFTYPADMMDWDWNRYEYAIAEPPPHSENAHNPDGLTPQQVETHLGWRLLDRDEITWANHCVVSMWMESSSKWTGEHRKGDISHYTYRTKLTREELAEARGIKKPVPWSKPEHVPPLCWIREKDSEFAELITSRGPDQIEGPDNYWTWSDLRSCEYSTTCRADDWHKPEVTP